jgi:NADH:ubiquinone oxidoreductase subunit H
VIPSGLSVGSTTSWVNQFLSNFTNSSLDSFISEVDVLETNFSSQNLTVDINYGVLFLLAVSGLNVYGIIIAG